MARILVLTEAELRRAVGLGEDELAAIEAVFPLISKRAGSMPPIMRIDVPEHHGEIDIKSAYLPGYAGIAVKVSAGFFDNPRRGLPSLGGLMIGLDSETGMPTSALFDNGFLTDLRTGLAGAVAAKHLARSDAAVAAVFGAGMQARMQLEALTLVRPIERAVVWARRPDGAAHFANTLATRLGIPVEAVEEGAEAAARADVLLTTTPAASPVVNRAMLHPGLHITAVGSDAETKQELDVDVIESADVFVCDSVSQSGRLGELRAALESGFDAGRAVELGQVIDGTVPGRVRDSDMTVCDLTGTGAQDTAIASLAVERCVGLGIGTAIDT